MSAGRVAIVVVCAFGTAGMAALAFGKDDSLFADRSAAPGTLCRMATNADDVSRAMSVAVWAEPDCENTNAALTVR